MTSSNAPSSLFIRAWVRPEVTFDLPPEWTEDRLAEPSDELTEMIETLASNAIRDGGIEEFEVDDFAVEGE